MILSKVICHRLLLGDRQIFVTGIIRNRQARQRSAAVNGLAGSLRRYGMFAYVARLEDDFSVPSHELGGLENIEPDPVTGYPCLSDNGIRKVIHDLTVLAGQRRGEAYVLSIAGVRRQSPNVTHATGMRLG